jgi:hypothetical protein
MCSLLNCWFARPSAKCPRWSALIHLRPVSFNCLHRLLQLGARCPATCPVAPDAQPSMPTLAKCLHGARLGPRLSGAHGSTCLLHIFGESSRSHFLVRAFTFACCTRSAEPAPVLLSSCPFALAWTDSVVTWVGARLPARTEDVTPSPT